jgi:hypothetical protein
MAFRPERILLAPSADARAAILEVFETPGLTSDAALGRSPSRHCVGLARSESGPWLVRDGAVLGFRWWCSCGANAAAAHTPPDGLPAGVRAGLAHFSEVTEKIETIPIRSARFNERFLGKPAPTEAEISALAREMMR